MQINKYGKCCSKYTASPYNGHTQPSMAKRNALLRRKSTLVANGLKIQYPTHLWVNRRPLINKYKRQIGWILPDGQKVLD